VVQDEDVKEMTPMLKFIGVIPPVNIRKK